MWFKFVIITWCVFFNVHEIEGIGVDCVPGELLNGDNCSSFFKCIRGRHLNSLKKFACPPGTYFSPSSSRCTHDPRDCETNPVVTSSSPPQIVASEGEEGKPHHHGSLQGPPSFNEGPFQPQGPIKTHQKLPSKQQQHIPQPPSAPPASPPLNPPSGPLIATQQPIIISGPPAPPVVTTQGEIPSSTDSDEETECANYELDKTGFYDCRKPGLFPSFERCTNFYVCINTMSCLVKGFKVECPPQHHFTIASGKCEPRSKTGPCRYVQDAFHSTVAAPLPNILLTLDNMEDFFTASVYWEFMPFIANVSYPTAPPPFPKPSDLSRGSKGRKYSRHTFFTPAK